MEYLNCSKDSSVQNLTLHSVDKEITLGESLGLEFSSLYKICVTQKNLGGSSLPICKNSTSPQVEGMNKYIKIIVKT